MPNECFAFKSAQAPLRLNFKVAPTRWAAQQQQQQQQGQGQQPGGGAPPHPHHAAPGAGVGGAAAAAQPLTLGQQLASLPTRTGITFHGDEVRPPAHRERPGLLRPPLLSRWAMRRLLDAAVALA